MFHRNDASYDAYSEKNKTFDDFKSRIAERFQTLPATSRFKEECLIYKLGYQLSLLRGAGSPAERTAIGPSTL